MIPSFRMVDISRTYGGNHDLRSFIQPIIPFVFNFLFLTSRSSKLIKEDDKLCAFILNRKSYQETSSADESTAKNWMSKSMIQNFRSSVALFML